MKKKTMISFVIFLLITFNNIYSLDTTSCKYFPLNVGNEYCYGSVIMHIYSTQIQNGKIYFMVDNFPFGVNSNLIRYDSTTGYLMNYKANSPECNYEVILFQLSGGTPINCYSTLPYTYMNSYDTNVFGISSNLKHFRCITSNGTLVYVSGGKFAKYLGLYMFYFGHMGIYGTYYSETYLKWAKINGKYYSDTSETIINKISENIPDNFSLSQNYPNPFNPTTTINFKVKSYQVIKLVVYDILGKEVAVLVNEKLQPGEYVVQFPNGQSANVQLSSGVYFYSLLADGERIETKKMLMIK